MIASEAEEVLKQLVEAIWLRAYGSEHAAEREVDLVRPLLLRRTPHPSSRNPRTSRMWPHKALAGVWSRALEDAELPHISLYEGTKDTMATDAIRRGVPERALQRFLGHASVQPTRRYARLADNALIEVLRPATKREDGLGDKLATKVSEAKPRTRNDWDVGPPGFEPGT